MTATVPAWSKLNVWALDSKEHEDELLQQNNQINPNWTIGVGPI